MSGCAVRNARIDARRGSIRPTRKSRKSAISSFARMRTNESNSGIRVSYFESNAPLIFAVVIPVRSGCAIIYVRIASRNSLRVGMRVSSSSTTPAASASSLSLASLSICSLTSSKVCLRSLGTRVESFDEGAFGFLDSLFIAAAALATTAAFAPVPASNSTITSVGHDQSDSLSRRIDPSVTYLNPIFASPVISWSNKFKV